MDPVRLSGTKAAIPARLSAGRARGAVSYLTGAAVLITFSGLDGSGKSTLINGLRTALEATDRRVAVLHMNDHVGVYAYLRWVRDRLSGRPRRNGHAAAPAAPRTMRRMRDAVIWSKGVRQVIYPLDLLLFQFYRLVVEVVQRRILIMDRYFYDTLVDVANGHNWGLLRMLQRVTPEPDVPVLIVVDPERAHARKPEHSVPWLAERWTAYNRVFPSVQRGVRVPNEDAAAATAEVARAVLSRLDAHG